MAAEPSQLRIMQENGVTHVEFREQDIIDEAKIQAIGQELNALIDAQETPRLLLNFTNVNHLTSAALGTLITINNRVRERDGTLRLANIDPQIKEVFTITRLDRLFNIHTSADEALSSFES